MARPQASSTRSQACPSRAPAATTTVPSGGVCRIALDSRSHYPRQLRVAALHDRPVTTGVSLQPDALAFGDDGFGGRSNSRTVSASWCPPSTACRAAMSTVSPSSVIGDS
jgi:hypothetical protein